MFMTSIQYHLVLKLTHSEQQSVQLVQNSVVLFVFVSLQLLLTHAKQKMAMVLKMNILYGLMMLKVVLLVESGL